ncbi:hypothetical protein SKAU_G00100690 [Synaphobranchus kaupii]|uniref:Uncharacterized protein n=1 Tax=Synaphobranchus kaupii TaxID=118154 RepID=A0A9Q1FZH5_SYNKA|nr:hypothetical protein SKAU_G00100690 [Synaphobranchus kaupii]
MAYGRKALERSGVFQHIRLPKMQQDWISRSLVHGVYVARLPASNGRCRSPAESGSAFPRWQSAQKAPAQSDAGGLRVASYSRPFSAGIAARRNYLKYH